MQMIQTSFDVCILLCEAKGLGFCSNVAVDGWIFSDAMGDNLELLLQLDCW